MVVYHLKLDHSNKRLLGFTAQLVSESEKFEGLKYDKVATYKIAMNVFLSWFKLGFKNKRDKNFFCSELLQALFNKISIRFKTDKNNYCLPVHVVSHKELVDMGNLDYE